MVVFETGFLVGVLLTLAGFSVFTVAVFVEVVFVGFFVGVLGLTLDALGILTPASLAIFDREDFRRDAVSFLISFFLTAVSIEL